MDPYREQPPADRPSLRDRGWGYRGARARLAASAVVITAAALLLPVVARSCRTRTAPSVPAELLTALSTFPVAPSELPPAVPLEPLLVADAPDRLAMLSPTSAAENLRPGEPLVVRFNRPMVNGAAVGKPVDPAPVTFSRPTRGRATWTSRSTLSFEAARSTWESTHAVEMKLSPELRSLAGEEVADASPHTVVFDNGPRLVGRRKGPRLIPGEPVQLWFSGKVEATSLGPGLMVYEIDGGRRMIPFSIAASARDPKGQTRVDLSLRTSLEAGAHLAVAVAPPLSQGGSEPAVVRLELAPRPHIEGIDCPREATEAASCTFTAPPGKIVDIGESLRLLSSEELADIQPGSIAVSPALEGLASRIEERKLLVIEGVFAPGQVYEVRVDGLRDKDGHALLRTPPLAVRSAGRKPEVRAATGHLTFEREAAAVLPISAIHVDAGEARVAAVPGGGEIEAVVMPRALVTLPAAGDKARYARVPLMELTPTARANRWGDGLLRWSEIGVARSSMVVLSMLPDEAAKNAGTLPTTFVQRTDLGIDAKVLRGGVRAWITSIATARPVAGAKVTIADPTGAPLAHVAASDDGTAWLPVLDEIWLERGVIVRATSGDDRAVMVLDPRTSMGPRHFGVAPGEASAPLASVIASVFTDRGIVRPGETLHVKALLRDGTDGRLALPDTTSVRLTVFGPSGEAPLIEHATALSAFGTADADFDLGPTAPLGAYRVEARVAGQESRAGVATFTVGDYRPPTFRVDLTAPVGELAERDALRVDVDATYMFGPPAGGRPAHFTITRQAAGDPEGWDAYTFGPVDASVSWGTMAAGDLQLDEAGRAVVAAPVEIGAGLRAEAVVEVSVSDVSGLATSARRTLPLYPASVEVGIREAPAWIEPGAILDVEAVAMTNDGKPLRGQAIEARIVREGWHRYWEWAKSGERGDPDAEGTFHSRKARRSEVAHRCKLTSGDEPVHCTWKPERSGTYVLEATTRDVRGRASIASQRVYVAAPDEHPDRDPPGAKLTLTPQRSALEVGETAELAFESPFPDAEALIEVHRDGVLFTEARRVSPGGNVFRFPVTAAMVPNAFVSLSLVRPRTGPPGAKVDLEAPDLRVGLAELTVRPAASPLVVTLAAPPRAEAGSEVEIDVFVEDGGGHGVEAEVALFVVDEGTLRVTGYEIPDPLAGLFPRMAPSFAWEDLRRSLVSRVTEPLLPGAGGDGNDAPARRSPEELERFEPTPLWVPHLVSDASGHASAVVHLPARATEYRIMAIAADRGIRTGSAEQPLLAAMPIVVRPVLPAIATVGDRFEAVFFVHNGEAAPVDVTLTPSVDGARRKAVTLRVGAASMARHGEWIDVEHAGDLDITLVATSDVAVTEARARVHAMPRGRAVRSSAVGAVDRERTLTIQIPDGEAGPFTLAIASHPFVGFDNAVDALLASPDAGVEATASSLIGLAAYAKLDVGARPGGVTPEELEARAASLIERLAGTQTPGGGFGAFTAHSPPDDYLTAFALHALSSASRAGFHVDEGVRKRAQVVLAERVRGSSFLDASSGAVGGGHDELAFALRALAEEGEPETERADALFGQRERLTPYGLAELALALAEDDFRRVTLAADALRVLYTREDEARTPSVLRWYDTSARTLGAVLEATSSIDAMIATTPDLASRLLLARSTESASWGSSHETSHALAGLAAYGGTFPVEELTDVAVTIDGARIARTESPGRQALYSLPPGSVAPGPHELRIEVQGTAWFAIDGSWIAPLGERDEIARGGAAALHRRFEDAAGKPLASGAHVKLGELVRVRLLLFTEHQAPPFVVVRDHLAGGLEPVDGALATSPRASLSALLGMGPDDDVIDARAHHAMRSLDLVTHREMSSREAVFYLASTGSGLHELTYGVRAVSAGTFVLPPAEVGALYSRGFAARSAMATLIVDP